MPANIETSETKRPLPANIKAAGFISLFTDVSSEMIKPVLPLFLANVLGVPKTTIGMIEGLAEGASNLFKIPSGWISDRSKKRKPLVLLGYSLSNLAKPLYGLSAGWQQLLGFYLVDRTGKGIRTSPRDALIADSVHEKDRGKAFGFHRMFDTIGAIIGPLITFFILGLYQNDYRAVFFYTLIPGVIAILLVIFFLQEVPAKRSAAAERSRFPGLTAHFYYFLFVSFIFSAGNSSDAFLMLRAENIGIPAGLIPILYLSFNVSAALFSVPAGVRSDRIGRKRVLLFGFALFSVLYLILGINPGTLFIWPLFVFYGLYYAATEGIQKAFIVDMAPGSGRATALGYFTFISGAAALLANLIAGFLWDRVSPAAPFYFGSAMALAAFLLLLLHPEHHS